MNNRKQLFIDYRFSAEAEGIRLSVNPPQKRGLVIKGEYPWEEGWMGAYATVIDDEGVYKMWYRAHSLGKDGKRGRTSFCYATSQDGIHWEKPRLGLVDFNGHLDNNIVLVEGELNSVFLDPQASPEQRYKALLTIGWPDPEKGGVYIAYSADGLRWQTHPQRLLPLVPDTQNQVFYDTRLGKYVAYVRCWAPWRKMGRIEIENLLEPWPYDQSVKPYHIWGEDKVPVPSYEFHHAISYDEHDPPITDIYTPCVVQYPWAEEVYLAFPSIYYHFPEPPEGKYPNDGLLEVQLAVSREGMTFHRPERRPYIPLGLRGGPEGGSIYMLLGMIRRGDEIYQYYTAFAHSHGEYVGLKELRGIGGIYLAVQRLDGFMSVDADYQGGWLTTPPLRFSGRHLELNIDCRATGQARVEIRDERNRPLPGYRAEECDLIRGNFIRQRVSWQGKEDLSALQGKTIRLHFLMRNAKLFAFQFGE